MQHHIDVVPSGSSAEFILMKEPICIFPSDTWIPSAPMARRPPPGIPQLFIITKKGDISELGRSRDDSLNSSDSEYAASSEADDGRTRRHKVGC